MDGRAHRIVTCVFCHGDDVRGNWSETEWRGDCVRCGTRFWLPRSKSTS